MFEAEAGLIFWTFVSFFILLLVLAKWGLPPLLKILKKREEIVINALKEAEAKRLEARQFLEAAQQKNEEEKKQLKNEIFAEKQNLEKIKQLILEEARLEGHRLIEEAQKTLEKDRQRVIKEIKSEMAELIVEVTKKFLRQRLSAGDQEIILKESLEELDKAYAQKNF